MSEQNIFEAATRSHLRFDTVRGGITTEDVWDLPLTSKTEMSLDAIGKIVIRSLKASEEESLVVKSSVANTTLNLKLNIIKHIIEVKLEEAAAVLRQRERKDKFP